MKNWKIPRGYSEAVKRSTNNTMTKKKKQSKKHKQWSRNHYTGNYREHERNKKYPGMYAVAADRETIPAPLVPHVVSLINNTNVMWYENCVGHQNT